MDNKATDSKVMVNKVTASKAIMVSKVTDNKAMVSKVTASKTIMVTCRNALKTI